MPVYMPGVKIPTTNRVVIPTSILISIAGAPVGFIQDLTYDTSRRVERIRELNAPRAGRIVEQIPSPEDITANGTGFCLYESNVISRIAKGATMSSITDVFFTITSQYIPFDVFLTETHPLTGSGFRVTLENCWLVRYSHPIRVGDLMISETFEIQPQAVNTENITDTSTVPTEGDTMMPITRSS